VVVLEPNMDVVLIVISQNMIQLVVIVLVIKLVVVLEHNMVVVQMALPQKMQMDYVVINK
jgi:hypothetical protein